MMRQLIVSVRLVTVHDEILCAESDAHSGPLLNANQHRDCSVQTENTVLLGYHTARPLKIIFLCVTHCKPLILLSLGVTLTLLIGFVFEEQVMNEKGGNVAWL